LLKTAHGTLMPLDLALPPVSVSILNQFLLNPTTAA
jgi:hypothetical protein